MGLGVEELLINFLFIVIPLFLYQIFWLDKSQNITKVRKIILVSLMSISIILCMSFPVKFGPDFLFDLRYIPFILGILYLGFPAALTGFIIILTYRYFLGGDGVYVNVWLLSLVFLSSPFLNKSFKNLRRKSKLVFTTIVAMLTALLLDVLVFLKMGESFNDYQIFFLPYILIQSVSMWFTTYLIEEMSYNKKIRQRILYTEKLNVIGDLSASISHEIRNPLTVTKGFLQMLRQDLSNDKKQNYINFALKELERGETIITDFLSLTKNEIENKIPINLFKELQNSTNIVTPYALIHNVDVKFETRVKDGEIWVEGDHNKFRQCFINLQKNSIEAMPKGGDLIIRTFIDKNKVIIEVEDTGIGMSQEQLSRIGTPYFTTKEKGTGLGTTLIFSTVHVMKGTVDVKSEQGKGTRFTIQLPICQKINKKQENAS